MSGDLRSDREDFGDVIQSGLEYFEVVDISDPGWQGVPLFDGARVEGELVNILRGCWLVQTMTTSGSAIARS